MVDLVYLDPPFNSNQDYAAPIGSPAEGAEFKDTWTMDDVKVEEHGLLADEYPAVYKAIDAASEAHGKGMMAYLVMMAPRLIELKRILKPTGSIYLHCDDTADSYLVLLLDAIFGRSNQRGNIAWKRQSSNNAVTKSVGRILDTILWYTKTDNYTFNQQYQERSTTELKEYRRDVNGRLYKCNDLTAPVSNHERQFTWRGATPSNSRSWIYDQNELENMLSRGEIELGRTGNAKLRGHVCYLDEQAPGQKLQNLWVDIPRVGNTARERTGYPTQKPLKLLERIIKASSNEGDLVLDPFCGCATTMVSAHNLDRNWIGIDISPKAVDLVNLRLRGAQKPLFQDVVVRDDIPHRTDLVLGMAPPPKSQKHTLYGMQEGKCAGCLVHFPFRNMTIDHIVPQSKGGTDHIENLQLLCGACNSMKGAKSQAEFMVSLKDAGLRFGE